MHTGLDVVNCFLDGQHGEDTEDDKDSDANILSLAEEGIALGSQIVFTIILLVHLADGLVEAFLLIGFLDFVTARLVFRKILLGDVF
jgi:hypothetical protein